MANTDIRKELEECFCDTLRDCTEQEACYRRDGEEFEICLTPHYRNRYIERGEEGGKQILIYQQDFLIRREELEKHSLGCPEKCDQICWDDKEFNVVPDGDENWFQEYGAYGVCLKVLTQCCSEKEEVEEE